MIEPYIKNTRQNQFMSLPKDKNLTGCRPGYLDFVMRDRNLRVCRVGNKVVMTENSIALLMQSSHLSHYPMIGSQEMRLITKKVQTNKIRINVVDTKNIIVEEDALQVSRVSKEQIYSKEVKPVRTYEWRLKLKTYFSISKIFIQNTFLSSQRYFNLDKNFVVSSSIAIVLLLSHGVVGQYQKMIMSQAEGQQVIAQQEASLLNLSQRISKVNPGNLTLPSTSVGYPSPVFLSDAVSNSQEQNRIVYLQGKSGPQGPQGAVGPQGPHDVRDVQGPEGYVGVVAVMQKLFGDASGNEFLSSSKSLMGMNHKNNFTVGGSSTFSGVLTFNGGLSSPETLSYINQSLMNLPLESNVENIWFASASIDGRSTFALNTIFKDINSQVASVNNNLVSDSSMYSSPVIAQNFQTLLSVNGKYSINQSSESLNLIQPTSGVQLEAFGNINSASSYLVTSTSYGGLDVSADVATLVLSG